MRPLPLIIFLHLTGIVFGQDPLLSASARTRGMGDVSAAIRDNHGWSPNPGAPDATEDIVYQFSVLQPFQLEGALTTAVSALVPVRGWMASAGVYRFGDGFHSRSSLMSGISTETGHTSVGVRMEYHQVRTEGFRTQGMFSWSAGAITRIGNKISVGTMATGMVQSAIGGSVQRIVPHFIAGVAVRPSSAVLLAMDVHKRPDRPAGTTAGVEYQIIKDFRIRMGMGIAPEFIAAGFGFRCWRLTIDQAVRYAEATGWSVQATAGYMVQTGKRKRTP